MLGQPFVSQPLLGPLVSCKGNEVFVIMVPVLVLRPEHRKSQFFAEVTGCPFPAREFRRISGSRGTTATPTVMTPSGTGGSVDYIASTRLILNLT